MSNQSYSFPDELQYSELKSMYPSSKIQSRRKCINGATFSAGNELQLVITKQNDSFADPNTLCLNFTADYNLAAATGTSTFESSYIIGSGYSHFRRQVVKALSNGQILETIDNPHLLVNVLANATIDRVSKQALSSSFGFNGDSDTFNTLLGHKLTPLAAASTVSISYSIPLISILNTMKLIPLFTTDFQIDLQVNDISNYIVGEHATKGAVVGVTIKDVEISCEVLTLENSSFNALMSQYSNGMRLKSSSYMYGGSTLPSTASVGTYDIVYSHSLLSLKRFLWYSTPGDSLYKAFSGVCPNANSWSLLVNSKSYPQIPVRSNKVSDCFVENQKSFSSLYSPIYNGAVVRSSFAKASDTFNEYSAYTNGSVIVLAEAKKAENASQWFQILDLELINNNKSLMFNGISTRGSSNTLRLNIGKNLAAQTHAIHFFSHYDCIVEFLPNGTINLVQ